jgi:TolB-like protein/DNA-binding winged helix-turn-helix (wHTH) protein
MKSSETVVLNGFRFTPLTGDLVSPDQNARPLRNRSAKVLGVLVGADGALVPKDEILAKVWPDSFASDESLAQCIADIRKALEDPDHKLIETIPRKGYRLNAGGLKPRRVDRNALVWSILVALIVLVAGLAYWNVHQSPTLPNKPRIAVLAFDDFSAGEDKGYLSDALAEGVITELARFDELSIIARASSFHYRKSNADIGTIGEELRANYVLEGSQQKVGDRLVVTVQLIDTNSAGHLWAERYERPLADLFVVQEEIVRAVAWVVSDIVVKRPLPASSMSTVSAMRYFMKARQINSNPSREGIAETFVLADKAIAEDPGSPWGYLGAGWARRHMAVHYAAAEEKSVLLDDAAAFAEKAIAIDPDNYLGHYLLASLHQEKGEFEAAIIKYQKAIELNPSAANVLVASSTPLLYVGRIDEAIEIIRQALEIDPKHRGWFHWQLAWAQWEKGRCQDALSSFQRMTQIPNAAHRMLAAVYSCLQRKDDATKALAVYLEENPEMTLSVERARINKVWPNEASIDRWLNDLAYAGMPQ